MPYEIEEREGEYCVIKEGGETVKCYPTKEEAEKLMAALYANVEDAKGIIWVKALGDMELEVLGVPFYGPRGGKDAHGEYFDENTNIHAEKYLRIPAVYYHGYEDDNTPQGTPEYIGTAEVIEKRSDGWWYRVILDKASEYAKRIWEAAKQGIARASSGSLPHLIRVESGGHIREWPVAELSLMDLANGRQPANAYAVALPVLKSTYKTAGISLPDGLEVEPEASVRDTAAEADDPTKNINYKRSKKMTEKELTQADIDKAIADGYAKKEAELKAEADRQAEIDAAVKAREDELKAEFEAKEKELEEEAVKARRPREVSNEAPYAAKYTELWKYDGLSPGDQAVMIGILDAAKRKGESRNGASENALKALGVKLAEDKSPEFEQARFAMKYAGIKSDEIMHADLTSYGDEWVGVAYSNQLWEKIRMGTFVAEKLPKFEMPPGHESMTIPLESGDPTFYKVAEKADLDATSGRPTASVTASQAGTGNKSITLAKMGARTVWSGELEEDSLIPFVSQLRSQLVKAGAEQLEYAIIDGDTATTASTNINDIAGSPAATDLFLLFNGFRKSCLVTTTANSRAGGTLDENDFLETVKLMGTGGMNGADVSKVAFIQDANVRWKSLAIATVKTRDVFSNPTVENGALNGIWGYPVFTSYNMHYKSSVRKANTSGKIDQDTTTNNTTGSILAVRWDQWTLAYRRRMTMEISRFPESDANQIVCLMRLGLAQRDTEASAITYNLAV